MPRPRRRGQDDPTIEPPITEDIPLRTCTMCGGENIRGPQYHDSLLDCASRSRFRKTARKQHLHFTCSCGYDWIEPVVGDTSDGLVIG